MTRARRFQKAEFAAEISAELHDLRSRLAEAEAILHAIRKGDVDAVVIDGDRGEQVYTLGGSDRIYRQLVETMNEAAVTLSAEGIILYCNMRMAQLLDRPLDRVLGALLRECVPAEDQRSFDGVLAQARAAPSRAEISVRTATGQVIPIHLSASHMRNDDLEIVFCLVLTDLSERRQLLYSEARHREWSTSFQRALLPPRLPRIPGCRFDAVYEPGESDARVGGDWYDAVRLNDGRVLVAIGDVAGSGHQAAAVMGVVRQIMRGIAQVHANPALMLDAADRALRLEHPDVFVTVWVGIVDLVTRSLTYASAGHPPALLASPGRNVRELSDWALPVGLRQGHQDRATTIALPQGSMLVLYTDGLSEANHDVVAGAALVQAAVTEVAATADRQPARAIQRQVLNKKSSDDVAILAVRFDFAQTERYLQRLAFDVRDAEAARRARTTFLATLTERGFAPIELLNAELVFSELIGNVLRHAATEAEINVVIDCSSAQTVLHVLDRGRGFRHISRLPSDVYSESGRGLFLIAELTDDFTVTERPKGGSHARAVLTGRLPPALRSRSIRSDSASGFMNAPA